VHATQHNAHIAVAITKAVNIVTMPYTHRGNLFTLPPSAMIDTSLQV
jgi:hypothetical protein